MIFDLSWVKMADFHVLLSQSPGFNFRNRLRILQVLVAIPKKKTTESDGLHVSFLSPPSCSTRVTNADLGLWSFPAGTQHSMHVTYTSCDRPAIRCIHHMLQDLKPPRSLPKCSLVTSALQPLSLCAKGLRPA